MSTPLPVGPFRELKTVSGEPLPYYIIPFDAGGVCVGPKTQAHVIEAAADCTDVWLFSHGWNNDWSAATERYVHFIGGVQQLRREFQLAPLGRFKPLLVGIFWPSQALSWFESETGPGFAGTHASAGEEAAVMDDVANALPADQQDRFRILANAKTLGPAEAFELSKMLAHAASSDGDEDGECAPSADDLMAAARSLAPASEPNYDEVGTATDADVAVHDASAAGLGNLLTYLDPRQVIKPFTVWQMKSRAGVVGHTGVAPLLNALLQGSQARIHLLGHSFGCKVVMTALCASPTPARQVESALLLQPAVSQYAFAAAVPERPGTAGGFHRALTRVRLPIVTTYSANDVPLTQLFHRSVRRADDLGELQYAGGTHGSPSRYGAMGGFGPQASQARFMPIQDIGADYPLDGTARILAIDGSRTIGGHGEISNSSTWWLSHLLSTTHGAD